MKGDAPFCLDVRPVIVFREHTRFLGTDNVGYSYAVTDSTDPAQAVNVEKQEAMRIIENLGMSLVHNNKYGRIYEMPGNPFYNKHANV